MTGITHGKAEPQSLLTHQIAHGIKPQHSRSKRKGSSRDIDGFGCILVAICGEEIGRSNERKSHFDGEEDANVDEIEREGADEEEDVEDGPHCEAKKLVDCRTRGKESL